MDKKDIPSPDAGCCGKLALLWYNNKPLAIFLLVLLTLIFLGAVFAVLWFFVLHPRQAGTTTSEAPASGAAPAPATKTPAPAPAASTPAPAPAPAAKAAHAAYLHLRNMLDH